MSNRECGSCTACCEGWLTSEKMQLRPGSACQHCTIDGCGIYERRPVNPCVSFRCAWLRDEKSLPDDMRPDLCGAIVMFDRRWKGIKVIATVPTGEKIPQETLNKLRTFAKVNGIPLMFSENPLKDGVFGKTVKTGYGPTEFVAAVRDSVGEDDVVRF